MSARGACRIALEQAGPFAALAAMGCLVVAESARTEGDALVAIGAASVAVLVLVGGLLSAAAAQAPEDSGRVVPGRRAR